MEDDPTPTYRLFTPAQITLATVIGSFIAGAVMMALNYRRLGSRRAARGTVAFTALGVVALCVVSFVLPENGAGIGLAIGIVVAMNLIANRLQGRIVREHVGAGGRTASGLATVGIGLLFMALLLALFVGYALAARALLAPQATP